MTDWSGGLAVYFAGGELWSTTGSGWDLLTFNTVETMQGWSGGLVRKTLDTTKMKV